MTSHPTPDVRLRPLRPDDAPWVRDALRDYLGEHLRWWETAYGRAPASPLEDLVDRDWNGLLGAGAAENGADPADASSWVRVAASVEPEIGGAGAGLGVVRAAVRPEAHMGFPVGVLQWIYVRPDARGRGVAGHLMAAANAWMDARGAQGKQVFVTAANVGAVRLYERYGYRVADYRMLGS